ncbi:MAG: 4Fe-4S dicluster domain-containing protein [Candidatus Bathyarchaeota archaeon]|nr:4Fe-4S dicluster domain-containing protein [Candidatus Bathyarchaeota archaeon]
MPYKNQKLETADTLTLEWILQVKNYKLTLDKNRCVGCQICSLACPKEAITVTKQPKVAGEAAKKAKIDIDPAKCIFCGICDITCPYGAVKVTLNEEHVLNVVDKDSFPELIRDIKIDTRNCPTDCNVCVEACPLNQLEITRVTNDGEPVENLEALSPSQKECVKVKVDIHKDKCPTCRACEYKCPEGAIKIRKVFEGKIAIDTDKCPEDCKDCVDVCPIKGTLTVSDDGKVQVNELTCTYCGACKVICPVDEALTLKRTKVLHTPIHSGTWNKCLERIASPVDAVKELKAKGGMNAKKMISKRFATEEIIK